MKTNRGQVWVTGGGVQVINEGKYLNGELATFVPYMVGQPGELGNNIITSELKLPSGTVMVGGDPGLFDVPLASIQTKLRWKGNITLRDNISVNLPVTLAYDKTYIFISHQSLGVSYRAISHLMNFVNAAGPSSKLVIVDNKSDQLYMRLGINNPTAIVATYSTSTGAAVTDVNTVLTHIYELPSEIY